MWCICVYVCVCVHLCRGIFVYVHMCASIYTICGSTKLVVGVILHCSPSYIWDRVACWTQGSPFRLVWLASLLCGFPVSVLLLLDVHRLPHLCSFLHGFCRVKLDSSSCMANSLPSETSLPLSNVFQVIHVTFINNPLWRFCWKKISSRVMPQPCL